MRATANKRLRENRRMATTRFNDCGCTACEGARTLDASISAVSRAADGLSETPPATIGTDEMARQNDRRRHSNAAFEPFQKLPLGASYHIEVIDGISTVMHRRDSKAEGGGGSRTGDGLRDQLREKWRSEVARNQDFAKANSDFHAKRAADPAHSVAGFKYKNWLFVRLTLRMS